MALALLPVRTEDFEERRRFAEFVARHYRAEIPFDDGSVAAPGYHYFWAALPGAATGAEPQIVGVTGYVARTPYLAETVKTVVDPAFRGRGLGRELSQAIEDEVRRRGFRKAMSTIYVTNLPMIFIKLAQGYRFEGFHPDHEKPGLDEYSFGKLLRESDA